MKKQLPILLVVFFLMPIIVLAQTLDGRALQGRVLNEGGRPLSGVMIQFKNKLNGTTTNDEGRFKITASKIPDTLVFSSVGFETYTVIVTERNIKDPNFEVVLLGSRKELSEVVVVGYGAMSKKEMTRSAPVAGTEGLSGRAAGLEVAPGYYDKSSPTIRIRGSASVTSSGAPGATPGDLPARSTFFADSNIGPRDGSLAKSRLLTAGEVNDFNKWKMWEDYTENEFKTYSDYWGIVTKKRYSIQLTDKDRNAIINEPLFLVDRATKDTVWTAYTDNTGKAELWGGFLKTPQGNKDYFITDHYGNTINHPAEFANGMNLLVANKSCQVTYDADIAFVVDATGSMGDEIEFLKMELEDVLRSTADKYKSLTLRTASVFYRDKMDEYLTRKVEFNEDPLKTLNFIKMQGANGGGDYPEAVDDALSVALNDLQWKSSSRTKLLFLVLDAPPHDDAKDRIKELTLKAAGMGIRIIPIACSGTDKSTEFLLRSMALATNGTYTFLTNHSGIGNPHIEPTTDKYEVELLNNLLQRIIGQFLFAKDCSKKETEQHDIKQPDNILSIKIYPNPNTGQFTIESQKDIKDIFITDFTGKILMRLGQASKKGRWDVNMSNYPSAMYLVRYITTDNKWGAEKVVVAR